MEEDAAKGGKVYYSSCASSFPPSPAVKRIFFPSNFSSCPFPYGIVKEVIFKHFPELRNKSEIFFGRLGENFFRLPPSDSYIELQAIWGGKREGGAAKKDRHFQGCFYRRVANSPV